MKVRFLKESHKRRLTEDVSSNFSAFITNIARYNEIGADAGEWVEFPIDESDFEEVLDRIGCNEPGQEEWFVTDYDCEVDAYDSLGEYPSFEELNEFAEMIEDDAFKAILEDQGDFSSAKDIYESGDYQFYPGVDSWTDFAYEYVDGIGGVEQLGKDTIERYFDYDQLGRDLSFDSYEDDEGEEISAGEYWCGDEDATDEEIGLAYVDAVGFDGVSNSENYLDYESFGRDLSFDGSLTDYGVIFIH